MVCYIRSLHMKRRSGSSLNLTAQYHLLYFVLSAAVIETVNAKPIAT